MCNLQSLAVVATAVAGSSISTTAVHYNDVVHIRLLSTYHVVQPGLIYCHEVTRHAAGAGVMWVVRRQRGPALSGAPPLCCFPAIYEIYETALELENIYVQRCTHQRRRIASLLTPCCHAAASRLTLTPLTLPVTTFGTVRRKGTGG